MQSTARVLKEFTELNAEKIAELLPIAEQASSIVEHGLEDAAILSDNNNGVAIEMPQILSQSQINDYIEGQKGILLEEGIPEEKHAVLIQNNIDYLNFYLENFNKASSMEEWDKKKLSILDNLSSIGYSVTHPVYLRFAMRTAELPLMRQITAIGINKALEFYENDKVQELIQLVFDDSKVEELMKSLELNFQNILASIDQHDEQPLPSRKIC